MVATKLSTYLNSADKNRVVVSSWAVDFQPGIAKCKYCSLATIKFKAGKQVLFQHSESDTHKKKAPKTTSVKYQISIAESLDKSSGKDQKEKEMAEKTKEVEISLVQSLSNHKIPPSFLNCLQKQLQKYCSDSDVITKMKLSDTKGRYILRHGISPTYQKETIELLRNCYGFSIGTDETEVNKVSELEILVPVATKEDGMQLRHYRTLDLYSFFYLFFFMQITPYKASEATVV